ncbi:MAG: DUF6435 family protein [Marinobacter sp.]|uniref:DUF6435 family protein n=1 Tax=Marinobacter sp. TaxID=50741 RepID=UPI003F9917DB
MLGFLKSNPRKKLQKAYEDKLEKAQHAQRNGDLRSHGALMEEAEKVYAEIKALDANQSRG